MNTHAPLLVAVLLACSCKPQSASVTKDDTETRMGTGTDTQGTADAGAGGDPDAVNAIELTVADFRGLSPEVTPNPVDDQASAAGGDPQAPPQDSVALVDAQADLSAACPATTTAPAAPPAPTDGANSDATAGGTGTVASQDPAPASGSATTVGPDGQTYQVADVDRCAAAYEQVFAHFGMHAVGADGGDATEGTGEAPRPMAYLVGADIQGVTPPSVGDGTGVGSGDSTDPSTGGAVALGLTDGSTNPFQNLLERTYGTPANRFLTVDVTSSLRTNFQDRVEFDAKVVDLSATVFGNRRGLVKLQLTGSALDASPDGGTRGRAQASGLLEIGGQTVWNPQVTEPEYTQSGGNNFDREIPAGGMQVAGVNLLVARLTLTAGVRLSGGYQWSYTIRPVTGLAQGSFGAYGAGGLFVRGNVGALGSGFRAGADLTLVSIGRQGQDIGNVRFELNRANNATQIAYAAGLGIPYSFLNGSVYIDGYAWLPFRSPGTRYARIKTWDWTGFTGTIDLLAPVQGTIPITR